MRTALLRYGSLAPVHARRSIPSKASLKRYYASAGSLDLPEIFDVVCLGGGPAGLTLLNSLKSSPVTSHLRVALLERQDLSRIRKWQLLPEEFSNRVSSLTPGTVSYLKEIGAWNHVDLSRVQAFQRMEVWDGIADASISFDWYRGVNPGHSDSPGPTVGYMTENLNLTRALLARIEELGDINVFDNTKVERISAGAMVGDLDLTEWPVLTTSDGRTFAARLLIGADGGDSPVRAFAGISSRGWDYSRHGLVATVGLDTSVSQTGQMTAFQRFLPTGPIAFLPLPNNSATLVWSTTPERASFLKRLGSEDFIGMVNAAFRLSPTELDYMHQMKSGQAEELSWRKSHAHSGTKPLPPNIVSVDKSSIASFPLKLRHADSYTGPRVALVGDAAHTIHPLAGQGLNQGQGDVQSLSRVLQFAVANGQDIGDPLTLEKYPADRYAANNALLGVVDKLHKLYAIESGPLVALRSLGLQAVDTMEPLKRFFMQKAANNISG